MGPKVCSLHHPASAKGGGGLPPATGAMITPEAAARLLMATMGGQFPGGFLTMLGPHQMPDIPAAATPAPSEPADPVGEHGATASPLVPAEPAVPYLMSPSARRAEPPAVPSPGPSKAGMPAKAKTPRTSVKPTPSPICCPRDRRSRNGSKPREMPWSSREKSSWRRADCCDDDGIAGVGSCGWSYRAGHASQDGVQCGATRLGRGDAGFEVACRSYGQAPAGFGGHGVRVRTPSLSTGGGQSGASLLSPCCTCRLEGPEPRESVVLTLLAMFPCGQGCATGAPAGKNLRLAWSHLTSASHFVQTVVCFLGSIAPCSVFGSLRFAVRYAALPRPWVLVVDRACHHLPSFSVTSIDFSLPVLPYGFLSPALRKERERDTSVAVGCPPLCLATPAGTTAVGSWLYALLLGLEGHVVPLFRSLLGVLTLALLHLVLRRVPGRHTPLGGLVSLPFLGCLVQGALPLGWVSSPDGPLDWRPWKGRVCRRGGPARLSSHLHPPFCGRLWLGLCHLPVCVWSAPVGMFAALRQADALLTQFPEAIPPWEAAEGSPRRTFSPISSSTSEGRPEPCSAAVPASQGFWRGVVAQVQREALSAAFEGPAPSEATAGSGSGDAPSPTIGRF